MTWSPEDWDAWGPQAAGVAGLPAAFETIQHVLSQLPDRHRSTLAVFGAPEAGALPLLAASFARVIVVGPSRAAVARARREADGSGVELRLLRLDDLRPLRSRLDVAVAVGAVGRRPRAAVDRALGELHASLTEGGVLLVTFPASAPGARPYVVWPRAEVRDGTPYHEIEAQYRLRRAGFRGLRLRRIAGPGTAPELLALAVRRAPN